MFHTTTATNYRNLLLQLKQLATSRHLSVVDSIAAGGTGYTVGDILTLSGGTNTHSATVEVLTAPGGVVGSVKIKNGGAYTVDPGDPVSTTGGTGTGCTLNCTFADTGWATIRYLTQIGLTAATLVNDGATYAANDTLTVSGGTFVTAATIKVLTVDGGGNILTFEVLTPGEYTVAPGSPVSVTGGAGSGATFTCTFLGVVADDELILEGEGGGTDEIFVGARTYFLSGPDVTNWELAGFTGYVATSTFATQPGVSPGRYDNQGSSPGGAFVPLQNASMTYWASITSRRIVVVAKASSNYSSLHLGFLNQFGTSTEFPYPLYIAGSSADFQERFSSSLISYSGIADPIVKTGSSNNGPGLYRTPAGAWGNVQNGLQNGGTHSILDVFVVYPTGLNPAASAAIATEDEIVASNAAVNWDNIIPTSGIPGTQVTRLKKTPMTTGDLTSLWPSTLIVQSNTLGKGIMGEMHGVFWISAEGISAEDTITFASEVYRVFKSGARGEIWTHFAMKEA